jgi:hypothetical protein
VCRQLNIKIASDVLREKIAFDTNAFPEGHVIGQPVPIFRVITPEELEHFKRKFSG